MAAPVFNIMLDMETLDTLATSAVLSMGAALFTRDKVLELSYQEFDLEPQFRSQRSISASTLAWWHDQSKEARAVFNTKGKPKPALNAESLRDFLNPFLKHVEGSSEANNPFYHTLLWANGASFDIPIWEHICASVGYKSPFAFGNHMCFRTFNSLTRCKELVPERGGTHHNAADDARWQAECVIAYRNKKKAK